MRMRHLAGGLAALGIVALCCGAPPEKPIPSKSQEQPAASDDSAKQSARHTTESLRGKVVWLSEALKRRYGVRLDADAKESMVVLETSDGELIPMMKEDRGRGFWRDPRIRNVEMELLVRRYEGSPFVQVIRVYTLKGDKKYELDYWCDICAIPMYELKECECCQGPIVLRERLVEGEAKP